MTRQRERDEHIERLYNMHEKGDDALQTLVSAMHSNYDVGIVDELFADDMIELADQGCKIKLTPKGLVSGRLIIRSHRLAERLLHDILGGDYESGACEFEHIVTKELVDSICILLGHPKLCPHGMPIPEGECCQKASRTASSVVVPLTELSVGQTAKVAYINSTNNQEFYRMDNFRIRPGTMVTLQQTYPAYVLECEGSNIAMDEQIVKNICVWQYPEPMESVNA
ncbi:MAG: metal-dependent transcriptional regulator, partial [Phycisphaeraceae bacterium]|nr:metal-dependent transcriptional regulator [Phycisphaeraceae bacterium]